MLASRAVELEIVDTICPETVRRALQKGVHPWRTTRFLIPPTRDARFVAAMEAVLDTYALPIDPAVPVMCFDEAGKEFQTSRRPSLPARPGRVAYEDPEYVRGGSAILFMMYAPHLGWRHVTVTTHRTAVDFARAMQTLVDVHFPAAERLIVVLDNLNTHHLSALYTTFPAAEAHRIARRLEVRFTPRHGSWLNMAELALAVLSQQCLAWRLPDVATLAREVTAWGATRNAVAAPPGGPSGWRRPALGSAISIPVPYATTSM